MRLKRPESPSLFKPFVVSLLVHGCLLVGIYNANISNKHEEESIREQPASIEIIFVDRNPQLPRVIETVVEEAVVEETVVAEVADSIEEQVEPFVEITEELSKPITIDNNDVPPVAEDELAVRPNELITPTDIVSGIAIAESTSENESDQSSLTPTGITNSIANYMASFSKGLSQSWLEECVKYQNKHGTKDCPQGQDSQVRPSYTRALRNNYVGRVNQLDQLLNNGATGAGNAAAISQLRQHYLSLVIEEPAWTPQKAPDKFNPDPVSELVGFSSARGLRVPGGFEFINKFDEVESPTDTIEVDADSDITKFTVLTPLFPSR